MLKPLLFIFLGLLSLNVYSDKLNAIPMHELKLLAHATKRHHLNPNINVSFNIWLKIRNEERLIQLVKEIYDPHSPRYQQFLTHFEYENEFAPLAETEESLRQYFSQLGMKVKIVNHNLRLQGTVSQIEQAFKVKMNSYEYQHENFFSNANEVLLEPKIAKDIASISGLNNFPIYHNNEG